MTRARDELVLSTPRGRSGRARTAPAVALHRRGARPARRQVAPSRRSRLVAADRGPGRGSPAVADQSRRSAAIDVQLLDARGVPRLPRALPAAPRRRPAQPPHHALTYGRAMHPAVAGFHLQRRGGRDAVGSRRWPTSSAAAGRRRASCRASTRRRASRPGCARCAAFRNGQLAHARARRRGRASVRVRARRHAHSGAHRPPRPTTSAARSSSTTSRRTCATSARPTRRRAIRSSSRSTRWRTSRARASCRARCSSTSSTAAWWADDARSRPARQGARQAARSRSPASRRRVRAAAQPGRVRLLPVPPDLPVERRLTSLSLASCG